MRHTRIVIAGVLVAGIIPANLAWGQDFAARKSGLVDYAKSEIEPRQSCESLNNFKSPDLAEITATAVPAGSAVPAHCRVSGVLSPEIALEVSLPAKWNGRFYMIGNGGLAGEPMEDRTRVAQRDAALTLGFAFAQTNTGHYAAKEPSGTFVLSNPQKAIDYAWRAVHLTAVTTKQIAREYYAKPVSYSYWNSCSNGGRQGLLEAQRFPEDFDGVVANSPWIDQTGFTIAAMWNQKAVSQANLTPAKLALLSGKVMAKCDAIDGLQDGLIDDPRKCQFDPARDVPACPAGTDGAQCLTAGQAAAIARIYSGPISDGKPFFPGFEPGSEAVTTGLFGGGKGSGWLNVIVTAQAAGQPGKPADFNLAEGIMRYLVLKPPQPEYDYQTFDFDRDIRLLDAWGKLADAKDPDLSNFRKRGGKLIITYGWADAILEPMMGVNYYEQAVEKNGRDTNEFFRLFMAPGMAHCGGGNGPNLKDSMTAIIDWVEKGRAPTSMVASRVVNDRVVRTRPLCPYPQVARYSGHGSIDDAANFRCATP
jgi:hypothetical protein